VIPQKTSVFSRTTVRTSNLTSMGFFFCGGGGGGIVLIQQ
jgi:hypothetical protein